MEEELPIINANPYTIYDVLKRYLSMQRSELQKTGTRSRAFVERWHDPLKIAAQLKREAEQVLQQREHKLSRHNSRKL